MNNLKKQGKTTGKENKKDGIAMEKKNKNKPINNAIYIISAFMLITVIALAMLSGVSPAKKTDDKKVTGTKDIYTAEKADSAISDKKDTEIAKESEIDTPSTDNPDNKQDKDVSAPLEFYLPVTGYLSKDYSLDMPVFSLTMNDYRTHSGIDIQATVGSAVSAVADGEVTKRYTDPFMGVCVEVSHPGGLVSRYMNLGEEYPKDAEVGCPVYSGQTIACVGESAAIEAADTSHLHFELLLDGKRVDPLDYISYEPMEDGYTE